MAYINVPIGGGQTAQLEEPARDQFAGTLGGAFEYSMTHFIYSVLRVMGEGMGELLAGFLVRFLDRVEPALVQYTRPLIDMLLAVDEIPSEFRDFLNQLREPTDAAAAALLTGLGTTVGGGMASGVVSSLMAPVTFKMNRAIKPGRPGPAEAYSMFWRGQCTGEELVNDLADQGYRERVLQGFGEIIRPRPDAGSLMEAFRRGNLGWQTISDELKARGYIASDRAVLKDLVQMMLAPEQIVQAWWRKEIEESEALSRMQQLGYSEDDAALMLKLSLWIPSPTDMIRFGVREAFRDDVAELFGYDEDYPTGITEWIEKQGGSEFWAKKYWRAHWELPSVLQGYEMLHRGFIDQDTLVMLLRVLDIPKFWRDKLLKTSYRVLTRVDVRRMYGLGVLTREDVKRSYLDLGYDDENAERMTVFTERYQKPADDDQQAEYRDLTRTVIESAYNKGILTLEEATGRMLELGYNQADIDLLLSMQDAKRALVLTPDIVPEYQRDIKSIVERSYSKGILSMSEATSRLQAVGFSENDCLLILAASDLVRVESMRTVDTDRVGDLYVKRVLTRSEAAGQLGSLNLPHTQQEYLFASWDRARQLRPRRLSEAQYRKALGGELISVDDYTEAMRGLGYTEPDIKILVAMATG